MLINTYQYLYLLVIATFHLEYTYTNLRNSIISTLFWATITDFYAGKRYIVGYYIGFVGIITSIMILAAGHKSSVEYAAYYWAGSVYACQATFFAWANDAMRFEDETFRGVVLASMNMFSGAVNAWWLLLFYSSDFAPFFTKGMYAMIGTCIALVIWTTGLLYMTAKAEKERGLYRNDSMSEKRSVEAVGGGGVEKADGAFAV